MRILLLFLFSLSSVAGLLPENFNIPKSQLNDEIPQEFSIILEEFKLKFEPLVIAQGGKLNIIFESENASVNATASRDGELWNIKLKGGLLKHKNLKAEVFLSILCHELGHHLAGAPVKFPHSSDKSWIAVEGQSDYYATNICLKAYYQNYNHDEFVKKHDPSKFILNSCKNKKDKKLCLRNVIISQMIGSFIDKLGQTRRGRRDPIPKLMTPDKNIVKTTNIKHPKPQCRLDTYFQGALCERYFTTKNPNCSGSEIGARPRCWFAPNKD